MNKRKKIGVIAIAAITAVLFLAISGAQAVVVDAFKDDVEGGNIGWTFNPAPPAQNLWHITDNRCNSPTHSWWYGQEATDDYDTGARNWGCIESPVIDLKDATGAWLDYWTWWSTEQWAGYDVKRVEISTDGGPWLLLEQLPVGAGQGNRNLNLSPYINNDVQIRYCFDTIDPLYNDYEGWYIDDIEVRKNIEEPVEGIEVIKTVFDPETGEWVNVIPCAKIDDVYTFQCEIHNSGDVPLTNVRFWDVMSCSLQYMENSARMKLPYGYNNHGNCDGWIYGIIPEAGTVFKQKYLHITEGCIIDPIGTEWHELYPTYCDKYTITSWHDTGDDGSLSPCDQIDMNHTSEGFPEGKIERYHVDKVVFTLNVTKDGVPDEPIYLESEQDYEFGGITDPIGTMWHEIYPNFSTWWVIIGWEDTNTNGYLDHCDFIILDGNPCGHRYHVEGLKPDIIVSREYLVDELAKDPVTLLPCETITIEFDATVVEHGYDCNYQYAKAMPLEGEEEWVYDYDTACINAPEQKVYLEPEDSSETYCHTVTVGIWMEACDFKSGQIKLTYDSGCADIVGYEPDEEDFMCQSVIDGGAWITFATDEESLSGVYHIGDLEIHCNNKSACCTGLNFSEPSALFDPDGDEKTVTWENGSFCCTLSGHICGDVNTDGWVDILDVGALHNHVACGTPINDEWAGDVVNCDGIDMGDVGLLHNHVQHGYALHCCV